MYTWIRKACKNMCVYMYIFIHNIYECIHRFVYIHKCIYVHKCVCKSKCVYIHPWKPSWRKASTQLLTNARPIDIRIHKKMNTHNRNVYIYINVYVNESMWKYISIPNHNAQHSHHCSRTQRPVVINVCYICMCLYVFTQIHTYKHMNVHINTRIYIHISIYICIYVCIYICIYIHTHTHTHVRIPIYCTHIHTCTYVCMYIIFADDK